MATDTAHRPGATTRELAGLDALELAGRHAASPGRPALGGDLAEARRGRPSSSLVWQLVVWTGWKPEYVAARPGRPSSATWATTLSDRTLWEAVATTLRARPIGFALAVVVGPVARRWRWRGPRCSAPAIGSHDHRPADHAVDRLVPAGDPAVRAQRERDPLRGRARRGAVDRQRRHHRRRPRAAAAAAGRPRCSAPAGSTSTATSSCRPRCPRIVAGLKQGWAFAWRSLMAGELLVVIAHQPSLGAQLTYARELSDAPRLLATMIVILVIGIVVDTAFERGRQGDPAPLGRAGPGGQ